MKKAVSQHSITINNKKYSYSLKSTSEKGMIFFTCKAGNIAQRFLREDVPALLIDLPELILEEKRYQKKQKDIIRFRISGEDKKKITKKALEHGYNSVSSYLRALALNS